MSASTPTSSITSTPSSVGSAGGGSASASPAGGTTTIADGVVSKIAGIAVRSVPGVHDLGGGAARAIGAIRGRLNQQDHSQGVSVEVGDTQVAADITIVAEYPMDLQQVADDIRAAVTEAIESYVGKQVTEVNVTITDVNIPSTDGSDDASRGQ